MKILIVFGGQGQATANLYDIFRTTKEGEAYLKAKPPGEFSDPHCSQLFTGIYQLGLFSLLEKRLKTHQIGLAGYSLGNVSAFLCSIHATLDESIETLRYRTKLMTSIGNDYDLLAIMGRFSINQIKILCQKNHCEIAIVNSDTHLVLGGKVTDLKNLLSQTDLIKYSKFLSIHAPSHTSYYKAQSEQLGDFLHKKFSHASLRYPIISPLTHEEIGDIHSFIPLLGKELCTRLEWQKVCQMIPEYGYEMVVDLGPGSAMTEILKKSEADLSNLKIITASDFQTLDGLSNYLTE